MTRIWGIRAQLITSIAIITMAAIGFMGILSTKVIEQSALMRKSSEAEIIAGHMKYVSKSGSEPLRQYIQDIRSSGRIGDVEVLDREGEKVFQMGIIPESGDGRTVRFGDAVNVKLLGGGTFYMYSGLLLASADIENGGKVIFTIPFQDIKDELGWIKRVVLYFSIIDSIIIISLGVYLLSKVVIRPIRKLNAAAMRIAEGRIGERVEVDEYNEIGNLARSFNAMANGLEEKIRGMERVNMELLSTQERLIVSEKLATVGRLAAGIAHEIGNPLGAILGYLGILIKDARDGSEEKEILERVENETVRINKIVRDFLDLSRPSSKEIEKELGPVDIKGVIGDAVEIFEPQRRSGNIELETDLKEGLPPVLVEGDRIKQVILNLLINARDAMPDGGKITLATCETEYVWRGFPSLHRRRDDPPDRDYTTIRKGLSRRAVCVSVTDTGPGIKDEDIGKVFDPFYSTKALGKGTGLGLFISQGIVHAYGGEIRAVSGEGKGTTFEIVLPVCEDEQG